MIEQLKKENNKLSENLEKQAGITIRKRKKMNQKKNEKEKKKGFQEQLKKEKNRRITKKLET